MQNLLPIVNTSSLVSELQEKAYREAYVTSQVKIGLPFQIKGLRKSRGWSQEELAERAGMAQPRISEIEKPGERRLNLETLVRLASAFDVALEVRFVPFSQLLRDSESFDPEKFEVPTFQQELEQGAFVPSQLIETAALSVFGLTILPYVNFSPTPDPGEIHYGLLGMGSVPQTYKVFEFDNPIVQRPPEIVAARPSAHQIM